MGIRLVVIEGHEVGREFEFRGHETFSVGRGEEAHFRLSKDDRHCSRLHFMIEVNPPLCKVIDLESNNGTFVNGTRIENGTPLKDGDRIKAGRTLLRVTIERDDPEGTLDDEPEFEVLEVVEEATLDDEPPQPRHRIPTAIPVVEVVVVSEASPVKGGAAGAARSAPPEMDSTSPRVPGYRLGAELGRGGMGVVYRAVAETDGSTVAVKLVHPAAGNEAARRRFLNEAAPVRGLRHRRIVSYAALGTVGEELYFVMEYVQGQTLAEALRQRGPLPVKIAVGLACQILEGVEAGHAGGWVHRDIKPSNLLLGETAGKIGVKITDFGLSRVYQASPLSGLSMMDESAGGPLLLYAAPEALTNAREVEMASDQYSVAVVLYELLTGKVPYAKARSHAQVYSSILMQPPVPVRDLAPTVPVELERILTRALAKKPEQRYGSALQFRQAIQGFM